MEKKVFSRLTILNCSHGLLRGGIKKAIDNSVIRNDSISGKGRTGIEVQEILSGDVNDWKKGFHCTSSERILIGAIIVK